MKYILLILLILIASFVSPVTAFQEPGILIQEDRYGPIVDDNPTSPAGRNVNHVGGRGSRYNTRRPLPIELQQNFYINTITCGGIAPSLVQVSDHILIGNLIGAQAQLSSDLSNVYSTYTIKVEETLKGQRRSPIYYPGSWIEADREGGRIRYPSGHILHFSVDGNGIPQVGKRYVFFLRWDKTEQSYLLITGYGLENGQVLPLDKRARSFAYQGTNAGFFMQGLEDEIKRAARPNKGKQHTRN